ncbi:MAG: CPP1-like family protein, partial [Halothece sp. Uz-M2-17]|nr:CPP1-like family protein [Halothece sp. Uz-M2-17]
MSEQNPYEQLGVTEDASFEEIQEAKVRLSKEYEDDQRQKEAVE